MDSLDPSRWRGIELRHFVALEAVAEERSFSRAAGRLRYTQSAVSQQIAALERAAGLRLVERGSGARGVDVTAAGALILAHARAVQRELAAAEAGLRRLADGTGDVVRLGIHPTSGSRLLPKIVAQLARSADPPLVQVRESPADEDLLRFLDRGELDVAVVHLPLEAGRLAIAELPIDPYVALAPPSLAPEVRRRRACVRELARLRLIRLARSRSASQLARFFHSHDAEPHVVFESDEITTIEGLVAEGWGIAVLPALATNGHRGLEVVELGELVPPRRLALVWRRDRDASDATAQVVEVARQAFAAA